MKHNIRRGRLSDGTITGKPGHSTGKYKKNPRIKHGQNMEGGRAERKRVPITEPFNSVHEMNKANKPNRR